jgi:hypothetical protein
MAEEQFLDIDVDQNGNGQPKPKPKLPTFAGEKKPQLPSFKKKDDGVLPSGGQLGFGERQLLTTAQAGFKWFAPLVSKKPSPPIDDEEFEKQARASNEMFDEFNRRVIGKKWGTAQGYVVIPKTYTPPTDRAEELPVMTDFKQGDIIEDKTSPTGYKVFHYVDGQWKWDNIVKPAKQYKIENEVVVKAIIPKISSEAAKKQIGEQIVKEQNIPAAEFFTLAGSDKLNQKVAGNPELYNSLLKTINENPSQVRTADGRFNLYNKAIVKNYRLDEDPFDPQKRPGISYPEFDAFSKMAKESEPLFSELNTLINEARQLEGKAALSKDQRIINEYNQKVGQIQELKKQLDPMIEYFKRSDVSEVLHLLELQNEGQKELSSALNYFPAYRKKVLEAQGRYYSANDPISFLRALAGGVLDIVSGVAYTAAKFNPLGTFSPLYDLKLDELYDNYKLWNEAKFTTPKDTGSDLINFANQALRSAPQMAAIIATKNPRLGGAMIIGAPTFAQSYNESLSQGLNAEQAYMKGVVDAGIQWASEAIVPEKKVVAGFKPSRSLIELGMKEFGSDVFNRTLAAELRQFWASQPLKTVMDVAGQYLEEQVADKATKISNAVTNAISGTQFETTTTGEEEKNLLGSTTVLTLLMKGLGSSLKGTNPKATGYRDFIMKKAAQDYGWASTVLEALKSEPGINQEFVTELERDLAQLAGLKFPEGTTPEQQVVMAKALGNIRRLEQIKQTTEPEFTQSIDKQIREWRDKIDKVYESPESAADELDTEIAEKEIAKKEKEVFQQRTVETPTEGTQPSVTTTPPSAVTHAAEEGKEKPSALRDVESTAKALEDKKADIEKRRQEELKGEEFRTPISEEIFEGDDINYEGEKIRIKIVTNKDGSRSEYIGQKGSMFGEGSGESWKKSQDISKDNPLTNEEWIQRAWEGGAGENFSKVESNNNLKPTKLISRINAKYDAELAELEKSESLLSKEQPIQKPDVGGKEEKPKKETPQSRAKKVYQDIGEIEEPSDARGLALQYFAGGGKVTAKDVDDIAGTVRKAALNVGRKEKKSSEVKARDYVSPQGKTIDEAAHSMWDNLPDELQQNITTQDIKNELIDVILSHNTRLSAATEFRDRYIIKDVESNLSDGELKEIERRHLREIQEAVSGIPEEHQEAIIELLRKYQNKYGFIQWERLEEDSDGFSPDLLNLPIETQNLIDGLVEKHIQQRQGKLGDIAGKSLYQEKTEKEVANAPPEKQTKFKEVQPPVEPPAEPQKKEAETFSAKEKAVLNRLYQSKHIKETAKKRFEEKGLTYEPESQDEAREIAKGIIDEYGVDDAITLAESNKFGGGVNTWVFAHALHNIAEQEESAKSPEKQFEHGLNWAETSIRFDEWARKLGRSIAAIYDFYKKSPIGVVLKENNNRQKIFDDWYKNKEKGFKELWEEFQKDPDFKEFFEKEVQERLKKERAAARKERVKKVNKTLDDAIDKLEKGGTLYSSIVPPKLIAEALKGVKAAYNAGEAIAKIISDAIDYISKKLGTSDWDKDGLSKYLNKLLEEKPSRKIGKDTPEYRERILEKFRKKLAGMNDEQKEQVIKRSIKELINNGALEYEDFKKIIADVMGIGELTEEQAKKMKELQQKVNRVQELADKARQERTGDLSEFKKAVKEGEMAQMQLDTMIYQRAQPLTRFLDIVKLNTLGIVSLLKNVAYNITWQPIRFLKSVYKTMMDYSAYGLSLLGNKVFGSRIITPEDNVFLANRGFFEGVPVGLSRSWTQLRTGLQDRDYFSRETFQGKIKPFQSWRDLWRWKKGELFLTNKQIADKLMQGTGGINAEVISRLLNVGDKWLKFGAERARAVQIAKLELGLKRKDEVNWNLFIQFPKEESFRIFKERGLSDDEAMAKAESIEKRIQLEGERAILQNDTWLNNAINQVEKFLQSKTESEDTVKAVAAGVAKVLKGLSLPYIKIPINVGWNIINLAVPEVALAQSAMYGYGAWNNSRKGNILESKRQGRLSKDWLATAMVGYSIQMAVTALVAAGLVRPRNDEEDKLREKEGETLYGKQYAFNWSGLMRWAFGGNSAPQEGDMWIDLSWLGVLGGIANVHAKNQEKKLEAKSKGEEISEDYLDDLLSRLKGSTAEGFQNGVFSGTNNIINAMKNGGGYVDNLMINYLNMGINFFQPATYAQFSKALQDERTTYRADNLWDKIKNSQKQRDVLFRTFISKDKAPLKISIWGEPIKNGTVIENMLGFDREDRNKFGILLWDDYQRTKNPAFFPSYVSPYITVNGKSTKLPAKEWEELQTIVGRNSKNAVSPLVYNQMTYSGKLYQYLSDEEKLEALDVAYSKAREFGVAEFKQRHPKYINAKIDILKEARDKAANSIFIIRIEQKLKNK